MGIKVLIVDDHVIVRIGLIALLQDQPDIEIVGSVSSGLEALSQLQEASANIEVIGSVSDDLEVLSQSEEASANIDVVILGISMPGMGDVEVAGEIQRRGYACRVVILSKHTSEVYVWQALRAGALGYVSKESVGSDLVKAIHAVHAGHHFFSPKIMDVLVKGYLRDSSWAQADPLACLNLRERQIVQLVVNGKSNSEIAQVFSLSTRTIQVYRSRIMQKLGAENLLSLIKLAIAYGLA